MVYLLLRGRDTVVKLTLIQRRECLRSSNTFNSSTADPFTLTDKLRAERSGINWLWIGALDGFRCLVHEISIPYFFSFFPVTSEIVKGILKKFCIGGLYQSLSHRFHFVSISFNTRPCSYMYMKLKTNFAKFTLNFINIPVI